MRTAAEPQLGNHRIRERFSAAHRGELVVVQFEFRAKRQRRWLALPQKSEPAPTARNMEARGKREAKRSASSLVAISARR